MLGRLGADLARPGVRLAADAEAALEAYPWPGNIRELRNVLERAVLLADGDELGRGDLRFEAAAAAADETTAGLTLEQMERRHIERVLALCGGNVTEAAERLDVARSTLYEKVKRHGLR